MYSETPRWCSLPSRGTYYLRPEVWLPGSWSNFSNWCDILLAGRVALSPRARRGVRAPHFGDVSLRRVVFYGWRSTIATDVWAAGKESLEIKPSRMGSGMPPAEAISST